MSDDPQIAALLGELAARKDRPGQEERVAQIREELKGLGHRAGSVSDGPGDKVETTAARRAKRA